ncbi:MAG: hypothetical protein KAS32_03050 [Candidatus Peribacteraceae bacterium]|nr:hypothetical protein [Candidatus Peribacteraceae bacterium]
MPKLNENESRNRHAVMNAIFDTIRSYAGDVNDILILKDLMRDYDRIDVFKEC